MSDHEGLLQTVRHKYGIPTAVFCPASNSPLPTPHPVKTHRMHESHVSFIADSFLACKVRTPALPQTASLTTIIITVRKCIGVVQYCGFHVYTRELEKAESGT